MGLVPFGEWDAGGGAGGGGGGVKFKHHVCPFMQPQAFVSVSKRAWTMRPAWVRGRKSRSVPSRDPNNAYNGLAQVCARKARTSVWLGGWFGHSRPRTRDIASTFC